VHESAAEGPSETHTSSHHEPFPGDGIASFMVAVMNLRLTSRESLALPSRLRGRARPAR